MITVKSQLQTDGTMAYFGSWGSAIYYGDLLVVPAIYGRMGDILRMLYKIRPFYRVKFIRVQKPEEFVKHLRNVRYSRVLAHIGQDGMWERCHCIEIDYEPCVRHGKTNCAVD